MPHTYDTTRLLPYQVTSDATPGLYSNQGPWHSSSLDSRLFSVLLSVLFVMWIALLGDSVASLSEDRHASQTTQASVAASTASPSGGEVIASPNSWHLMPARDLPAADAANLTEF